MSNSIYRLQKVLLFVEDDLGIEREYKPTQFQKCCQPHQSSEDDKQFPFHEVDFSQLAASAKTPRLSTCIKKKTRNVRQRSFCIGIDNIQMNMVKNEAYNEFSVLISENLKPKPDNNVFASAKLFLTKVKKWPTSVSRKRSQKRRKEKPVRFSRTNNDFCAYLWKSLGSYLKEFDYLTTDAVFSKDVKNPDDAAKMFISCEINNKGDIRKFLRTLVINDPGLKTCGHKSACRNFCARNTNKKIAAIIRINPVSKQIYLHLNKDLLNLVKNKNVGRKMLVANRAFINSRLLKIKLRNIKLFNYHVFNKLQSDSSSVLTQSPTESSLMPLGSISQLIHNYEKSLESSLTSENGLDKVMQDAYRILMELQLQTIEQCNKIYLNYFLLKDTVSEPILNSFNHDLKKNCSLVVNLQKSAIDNSKVANSEMEKVNKIMDEMIQQLDSSSSFGLNKDCMILPSNLNEIHVDNWALSYTDTASVKNRPSILHSFDEFYKSMGNGAEIPAENDTEKKVIPYSSTNMNQHHLTKEPNLIAEDLENVSGNAEEDNNFPKSMPGNAGAFPAEEKEYSAQKSGFLVDSNLKESPKFMPENAEAFPGEDNGFAQKSSSFLADSNEKSKDCSPKIIELTSKSEDYAIKVLNQFAGEENRASSSGKVFPGQSNVITLSQKEMLVDSYLKMKENGQKISDHTMKSAKAEDSSSTKKNCISKEEEYISNSEDYVLKSEDIIPKSNDDTQKSPAANKELSPSKDTQIHQNLQEFRQKVGLSEAQRVKMNMAASVNILEKFEQTKMVNEALTKCKSTLVAITRKIKTTQTEMFSDKTAVTDNLEKNFKNILSQSQNLRDVASVKQIKEEVLSVIREEQKNITDKTIREYPKRTSSGPEKEKLLQQIQVTLKTVSERFMKNTTIIQKAASMQGSALAANNLKRIVAPTLGRTDHLMKQWHELHKAADIIRRYKPVYNLQPFGEINQVPVAPLVDVTQAKEDIEKNLKDSLKLLNKLNEVTKNIKNQPGVALKFKELEESVKNQRKQLARLKFHKSHLTLTPIKNFINTNKQMVNNNALRLAPHSKYESYPKLRSESKIPLVQSKHFIQMPATGSRGKKSRKLKSSEKCTQLNRNIKPVIQTVYELPLDRKVIRPVRKCQPWLAESTLSGLTLQDVQPFQPEYPRKDNLTHLPIQNSYLYKIVNNVFSTKTLEPLIKCSDKSCTSCSDRLCEKPPTGDLFYKGARRAETPLVDLFSGARTPFSKTPDKDPLSKLEPDPFDFKKYMTDPGMIHRVSYTICPVSVNNTSTQAGQPLAKLPTLRNLLPPKPTVFNPQNQNRGGVPMKKITYIAKGDQNKIQKAIQKTIMNNQEKFRRLQGTVRAFQAGRPMRSARGSKIALTKATTSKNLNRTTNNAKATVRSPSILTQPTRILPNFQNRPGTKPHIVEKKQYVPQPRDENIFHSKYKNLVNISRLMTPESTEVLQMQKPRDVLLQQISKTVRASQSDIQKYVELVEQRFLKTFSLPEREKVSAFSNLETEIKHMLTVLNSKDTSEERKLKILKSVERLQGSAEKHCMQSGANRKKSAGRSPDRKSSRFSPVKKRPKSPENAGDNREKNNRALSSGKSLPRRPGEDKKKVTEDSQPTVCTDSINFKTSLSAIISKQIAQNLPNIQPGKKSRPGSAIKSSKSICSSKSSSQKRVRFKSSDPNSIKSDTSVNLSSEEDEYSTFNEETISDFSFDAFSGTVDFLMHIHYKTTVHYSHVVCTALVEYIPNFYETIEWSDAPEAPNLIEIMPENYDFGRLNSEIITTKSDSELITNCSAILMDKTARLAKNPLTGNALFDPSKKMASQPSPRVLEFLDMLTNISTEVLSTKKQIYYKSTHYYNYVKHQAEVYHLIQTFHEITYSFTNYLSNLTLDLSEQSNQLNKLLSENQQNSENYSKIISVKNSDMRRQFSSQSFSSESLNYQITVPFNESLFQVETPQIKSCLELVTYNGDQKKLDELSQTLVLNLQMQSSPRRKGRVMKVAKRAIVKSGSSPRNRLQIKRLEIGFGLKHKHTPNKSGRNFRKMLILLYVSVFSLAFSCMTLNYKCE